MPTTFKNPDAAHLCGQLRRIADALEALVSLSTPEPTTEEPLTCPHPTETRLDLGMTNGKPEWICGVCQARSPA